MINSILASSILLQPYWIKEKLLKIFSECEHGHDVMKLCHQLTKNYVTLHTIVIPQPEPAYIPDPAHDLVTDFFTGISLKTGGKFFQIPDVKFRLFTLTLPRSERYSIVHTMLVKQVNL